MEQPWNDSCANTLLSNFETGSYITYGAGSFCQTNYQFPQCYRRQRWTQRLRDGSANRNAALSAGRAQATRNPRTRARTSAPWPDW